jgi:hypothetical protein
MPLGREAEIQGALRDEFGGGEIIMREATAEKVRGEHSD